MKKRRFILSFVFIIFVSLAISYVNASSFSEFTSKDLMYIEINGTGRIIKPTTTIDEIASWYGNRIALETDSLYGGKAYSFYYGNNFDDYLYIETISDGTIFSYGSVDPSFRTNTYNFGDKYPYNERNSLYGCLLSDGGIVTGAVFYNKSVYLNGNSTNIIKAYRQRFETEYCKTNNLYNSFGQVDPSKIGTSEDLGLQSIVMLNASKHGALMYNGLMHYYGKDNCFAVTDRDANGKDTFKTIEEYFYINNQFIEFKTNLFTYVLSMGFGSSFYNSLGATSNVDVAYLTYYIFNPLQLGGLARLQKSKDLSQRNIPVWTYNYGAKTLVGLTYSSKIFDRNDPITLTHDEANKLASGRAYYAEAIDKLNRTSQLYKTMPVYTSTSKMYAGELLDSKKEGITAYFNAIRAGAGLGTLKQVEEGFNIAQHLTTLLAYRFEYLGLGLSHHPEKPSGLSDAYYKTAVADSTSWGSSLSYAAKVPNAENMMFHINNLLLDDDGTFALGHRRSLTHPGYSLFGYGITEFFGEVNLNGYQEYDYEANGWPAVNGVTFMESLIYRKFLWSAAFNPKKYTVLNSTRAEITCLNTGAKYTFDKEQNDYGKKYQNIVDGQTEFVSSVANKVVMYDSNIEPMVGYVYQVTIKGLKNVNTGRIEDYTYRTIFEYADEVKNPTLSNSLTIDTSNLHKMEDYVSVYQAPIGMSLKLSVLMEDTSVVDKKMTWTSSNPDVISVTQDGTIFAKNPSEEQVIISVKFDGSNISDQIILMPYIKLDDVKLNPSNVEMEVNGKQYFCIEAIPGDANEILGVRWALNDGTNEYVMTKTPNNSVYKGAYIFQTENNMDNNLNNYITVDSVNTETGYVQGITLKAIEVNENTKSYTLKAYVTAMSDMYNSKPYGGASVITVDSKIESVKSYIVANGKENLIDDTDKPSNTSYNLVVKGNGPYEYPLIAKTFPEDALEVNSGLSWEVIEGKNIASISKDNKLVVTGVGNIRIARYGVKENDNIRIKITAPLEKLEITSSLTEYIKEGNYYRYTKAISKDAKTNTLELTVKRTPSISEDKVVFSVTSEDVSDVATINGDTGLLTFKKTGNVKVIASAKNNAKVNSNYYYIAARADIENFRFTNGSDDCTDTIEYFNVDFDKFKANGNTIVVDGPTATYEGYENVNAKTNPNQIIKYYVRGNVKEINGVKSVKVNESTGKLTIGSAIEKEDNIQIVATVKNVEGVAIERYYTLMVNKASNENNIDYYCNTASYDENSDGTRAYYLVKNSSYNFKLQKDPSSNDILSIKEYSSVDKKAEKNPESIVCEYNGDSIQIKPTKAGEFTVRYIIKNAVRTVKYPLNDNTGVSYLSDLLNKEGKVNKLMQFKIVVLDYQKGDVNKDGYINSTDAAIVLDLFKNGGATQEQYNLGDMDNNNILNSTDSAMILDIYKNN